MKEKLKALWSLLGIVGVIYYSYEIGKDVAGKRMKKYLNEHSEKCDKSLKNFRNFQEKDMKYYLENPKVFHTGNPGHVWSDIYKENYICKITYEAVASDVDRVIG